MAAGVPGQHRAIHYFMKGNGNQHPSNFPSNGSGGFPTGLPPNFDLNSLNPAERDMLLRHLQAQQLQRARQFQQQQMSGKLNANGYPRPPGPMNAAPYYSHMPISMMRPPQTSHQQQGGIYQIHHNQVPQSSHFVPPSNPIMPMMLNNQVNQAASTINPAVLNPVAINPTQLNDNSQAMDTSSATNFFPPSQMSSETASISISLPPFDEKVMASEGSFAEHLIRFMDAFKYPNRRIPQIAGRPVNIYRLFQVVNSAGGFIAVSESKKWPLVTQALQFPPQSIEIVITLRSTYYNLLYPYEQYFIQKRPAEAIEWPQNPLPTKKAAFNPVNSGNIPPPLNPQMPFSQVNSQSKAATSSAVSTAASAAATPARLAFIPDSELHLWRPFYESMQVPVGPIISAETAILYLKSPHWSLRLEALLAFQKFLALAVNSKEYQAVGFISVASLNSFLDALRDLWREIRVSLTKRDFKKEMTMEDYWSAEDQKRRSIPLNGFEDEHMSEERNRNVARQVVYCLRLLSVQRIDLCPLLASSSFCVEEILLFTLLESADWELYKDSLVILDSLSSNLSISGSTTRNSLLKLQSWALRQCELELNQVRRERLTSFTGKLSSTLSLERFKSFENVTTARQTVSLLITQCAQMWKSVPLHIFIHLTTTLHLLSNRSLGEANLSESLEPLATEVERFLNLFVGPGMVLLRSIRALYEALAAAPSTSTAGKFEELRKILETVFYAPTFSLTDGGYLELCLQLLGKCQDRQPKSLQNLSWTGAIVLVRECREFWRHSWMETMSVSLSKSCYLISTSLPNSSTSPSKKGNPRLSALAISKGPIGISATFSHPFMLLNRSLDLLVTSFPSLSPLLQLDLLEMSMEWNVDVPCPFGREILNSDRFEPALNTLRDYL